MLPPPSSSNCSCTWNLQCQFFSKSSFSVCSLVAVYFCGPAVSDVVLVWQCCHRFFSVCVFPCSIPLSGTIMTTRILQRSVHVATCQWLISSPHPTESYSSQSERSRRRKLMSSQTQYRVNVGNTSYMDKYVLLGLRSNEIVTICKQTWSLAATEFFITYSGKWKPQSLLL